MKKQLLLFFLLLINFFIANARTILTPPTAHISYANSTLCTGGAQEPVLLTGTGDFTGGIFMVSPSGLSVDSVTGTINPSTNLTGTYLITYMIPSNGIDPSYLTSTTVTINQASYAGADGSLSICNGTSATIDLYSLIQGEQPGGIWTRTAGVGGIFNAATATFTADSESTNSMFTYTVTGGTFPCVDDSSIATIFINLNTIPQFPAIASICSGSAAPNLPTTSLNGITGTWFPAILSNIVTGIYTFTPNLGQCAVPTTMNLEVNPLPIATISASTTVFEGSSAVVTFTGTPNAIVTYQYNGGPNQTIILDVTGNALFVTAPSLFSFSICLISATDIFNNCNALLNDCATTTVIPVPAPIGSPNQTFSSGATLADVVISGTNIQWYDALGRNVTVNPLPLSTLLVNGATYFASQTINGYESQDRLAVTVQITLASNQFDFNDLAFGPNPIEQILNIRSSDAFKSIKVYNNLGQEVYQQSVTSFDLKLDLGFLKTGNYFIKLESDQKQQVIKVIKR